MQFAAMNVRRIGKPVAGMLDAPPPMEQLAGGEAATVTVVVAVKLAADVALGATVNVFAPMTENVTGQALRLLQAVICVPLDFHT